MPYLSALDVCSRRGAIQIHVYLTLPYAVRTVNGRLSLNAREVATEDARSPTVDRRAGETMSVLFEKECGCLRRQPFDKSLGDVL